MSVFRVSAALSMCLMAVLYWAFDSSARARLVAAANDSAYLSFTFRAKKFSFLEKPSELYFDLGIGLLGGKPEGKECYVLARRQ